LFRRWGIAEADGARDFLLKTGLKSEFGPVVPDLSVAKSNWLYAVSSDSESPSPKKMEYILDNGSFRR
jgi:hypothetical protein